MKTPSQADMQKWSDEVARDPRSLAFLPLARAYRRQGLRDQAIQLCLRGLEAYPSHAEGHGLLALLYLENGDHQRAADEWSMVLRIDRDNFDALRGMGFCYLEQDQLSRARQSLERAALLRPTDATVQEALRVLGTRHELAEKGIGPRADKGPGDDPWAEKSLLTPQPAEDGGQQVVPAGDPRAVRAPEGAPAPRAGAATSFSDPLSDPGAAFDELLATGPLLGALLVDAQGLVLAGRLTEAVAGEAAVLGAVLGGAVGEAARTVAHLGLGRWRGMLLESEHALLHLAPAAGDGVLVLAARRATPPGWMLRAAAQAAEQAARLPEVYG
jgi:predicted regulator of Ras-like GTPase activity (Roadblock/LC7/MglB family)